MQARQLGTSDIQVSSLCLGTMTWGEQNSESQAHAQLNCAVDHGINFIDTAELYPVPPMAETQGRTEEHIGTWLHARHTRDDVIIATKVAGPSEFRWIRNGARPRFSRQHINEAIDGSLRRLQTDYIDLYQLHWPERNTNYFGNLNYAHLDSEIAIPLEETLAVLNDAKRAGKIREIGISNESPWGTNHCLRLAREHDLPRVQSIQNPYSLLNRSFEVGLAEIAIRDRCGLLPYSVLGFGVLSGKYFDDDIDLSQTRIQRWPEHFGRYSGSRALQAAHRYVALARQHNLNPTQMAIKYVESRPFVTSCIIGATSIEQLQENIAAAEAHLSSELLEGIDEIEAEFHYPAP